MREDEVTTLYSENIFFPPARTELALPVCVCGGRNKLADGGNKGRLSEYVYVCFQHNTFKIQHFYKSVTKVCNIFKYAYLPFVNKLIMVAYLLLCTLAVTLACSVH